MGQNILTPPVTLMAEEGQALSSGSLRLYALPYGCIDLYNYDPINRRCAVGIMVATEHRRQGHALAMLKALEELYSAECGVRSAEFEARSSELADTGNNSELQTPNSELTLHQLFADIAATNAASLSLFRKAGYTECGHFRDWLAVDGRYVDTIRMQKIIEA